MEKICDTLQISRAWLSKTFKEKTGMTLLEYIHRQRLERAKKMMLEDGAVLEEVAKQCGYYARRSMTEAFKNYEGITPSKYRELFQSGK